ncbi:MAG: UDP-N-acetylmuramate dehydrogenase [Candidatus Nealsonbacteria bacterium]
MSIKKLLPRVKTNTSLKNYTTFKIGGRAKYFYVAKTKENLVKAVRVVKKMKLPFFVLGGGSNLLISDKGFKGLVIKFGQPLSLYVSKGLEWAVGIPGTIQGAVWSNAGAFKKSMKDVVKEVEVFDTKTGKVKIFKNKDCRFSYRNSIFRKEKNLIILSVKIKSKKSNTKKIKQYSDYRKKTQPLEFPSAGSIFKNPKNLVAGELLGEEDKPSSSAFAAARLIGEEDKPSSSAFAAARLIEECGLKGKKIGEVQVSKKHANFIINLGDGKARDVKKLINLIKRKVKSKFGANLEEEIQYLGF